MSNLREVSFTFPFQAVTRSKGTKKTSLGRLKCRSPWCRKKIMACPEADYQLEWHRSSHCGTRWVTTVCNCVFCAILLGVHSWICLDPEGLHTQNSLQTPLTKTVCSNQCLRKEIGIEPPSGGWQTSYMARCCVALCVPPRLFSHAHDESNQLRDRAGIKRWLSALGRMIFTIWIHQINWDPPNLVAPFLVTR